MVHVQRGTFAVGRSRCMGMQLSLSMYSSGLHTHIPRHWNTPNNERSCCWEAASWAMVPMQFVLFFPLFASVPQWLCITLIKKEGVFKETHSKLYLNSLSVITHLFPSWDTCCFSPNLNSPEVQLEPGFSEVSACCGGSMNNLRGSSHTCAQVTLKSASRKEWQFSSVCPVWPPGKVNR